MKKYFVFLFVMLFVISFTNLALATDRYVGGGGTPNYTTIQDAITASSNGDIIHVAAGTYSEQVNIDKSITLLGAQANVAPISGGRLGGESIILGGTSGTVGVGYQYNEIDINADDVEVNGFELSRKKLRYYY